MFFADFQNRPGAEAPVRLPAQVKASILYIAFKQIPDAEKISFVPVWIRCGLSSDFGKMSSKNGTDWGKDFFVNDPGTYARPATIQLHPP